MFDPVKKSGVLDVSGSIVPHSPGCTWTAYMCQLTGSRLLFSTLVRRQHPEHCSRGTTAPRITRRVHASHGGCMHHTMGGACITQPWCDRLARRRTPFSMLRSWSSPVTVLWYCRTCQTLRGVCSWSLSMAAIARGFMYQCRCAYARACARACACAWIHVPVQVCSLRWWPPTRQLQGGGVGEWARVCGWSAVGGLLCGSGVGSGDAFHKSHSPHPRSHSQSVVGRGVQEGGSGGGGWEGQGASQTTSNRLSPPQTTSNRLKPPQTASARLKPPQTASARLKPSQTASNRLNPSRSHLLASHSLPGSLRDLRPVPQGMAGGDAGRAGRDGGRVE
jgi:hypothetical protein